MEARVLMGKFVAKILKIINQNEFFDMTCLIVETGWEDLSDD